MFIHKKRHQPGVYVPLGALFLVFHKFIIELQPLIDGRISFLLNIFRTNEENLTKFCIHINTCIDKV